MSSPYLSVSELSLLLGKSEKWCYQKLSQGLIPGSFKIGGTWFIDKEILTNSLKTKATQSAKPVNPKDLHGLA